MEIICLALCRLFYEDNIMRVRVLLDCRLSQTRRIRAIIHADKNRQSGSRDGDRDGDGDDTDNEASGPLSPSGFAVSGS